MDLQLSVARTLDPDIDDFVGLGASSIPHLPTTIICPCMNGWIVQ